MSEKIAIRPARLEDAEAIATVQMKTWQMSYAGIFPAEKLDTLGQELHLRIERWESILSDKYRQSANFVAEVDRQVVGFANAGRQLKAEYPHEAELFAIYILPEFHGKGIGRRLLTAAADQLHTMGFKNLLLWVLADNSSSRGFYEALGGKFCGEDEYLRWGQTYKLAAYGWDSLDTLSCK